MSVITLNCLIYTDFFNQIKKNILTSQINPISVLKKAIAVLIFSHNPLQLAGNVLNTEGYLSEKKDRHIKYLVRSI